MAATITARSALTTLTTLSALCAFGLLCSSIGTAHAQENVQLQIPPSLVECYNTSYFMNRANRLPATIETLISLIEKVENAYGYNGDMRTLAVGLLQRFRQDGIQRAPGVTASYGVIPYSPIGFQFPKFRILLSRLIPGNALNFPNNTLTREERCSLHFMLSSSFDTRVRGDENQVCNQLSQYRAQRLPRAAPTHDRNNFMGDVELLETLNTRARKRGANVQQARANGNSFDVDWGWPDSDYGYSSPDNSVSQCPVENGVIWTPWGTVAAGTLMAGIATGLQPETVKLRTLLALSRRPGATNLPQTATVSIDNRWAATLAGDLAEVALVQVPVSSSETASVGANGAWNSTVMPKWYFLTQRQNMEMTDAEIRGGLDGLILAMNIATWRTQSSAMKLSQLLRMYYSMDGVLGSGIMACNRKDNFPNVAPLSDIIAQTSAFAQVLDREMQLRVTLSPAAIAQFSTSAANALTAYVPQSLNDVSCSVSSALPQDITQSITPMTDIYVFLDTTWQYANIVDYVAYILNRLNINPYASSVTLLAANDGTIIVNTTNYLMDVYQQWNVTTHALYNPGFNLPTILRTVQNLTQAYMNGQQANNSVGGRSLVALLIPYSSATVNSGDSSYSTTQLQYIYEQIPDLHFIYYTGGTVSRFEPFVRTPSQDLFTLNTGNNVASSSGPVVMRIKQTWISSYCYGEDDQPQGINNMTAIVSNVFVFLDTTWPYRFVVNYVNYVLQRLNINPYASAVTLLSAADGTVMVNTTHYLSDLYTNWNVTTHSWYTPGFSLPQILTTARDLAESVMNADRNASTLGGQSLVALLVPSATAFVSELDLRYSRHFLRHLNYTVPDLHFIYYAGGALVRFKDVVSDPNDDLYPLSNELAVPTAGDPLVQRIRRVPRRLANPRCGADWWSTAAGADQMLQYVRLGDINFYRIMPNYFYSAGSMRYLRVQPLSAIAFTVCTSRTVALPHRNDSVQEPAQQCAQTAATNGYSVDLTDLCTGYRDIVSCPPLYLSVQAQTTVDVTQVSCTAAACPTPNAAQFSIYVYNLDCNASGRVTVSQWTVSSIMLLVYFSTNSFIYTRQKSAVNFI